MMKQHLVGVGIVILLSYWAVRPLLSPGYFPMHDDTQVGRVVVMGRALSEGQFPVRWVADLGYGYGYPLFNFYGPWPYYVGGAIYLLGFSGLVATKAMMAIGIILPALTAYFLVARFLGRLAGMVAAVFLTYAPYHAVQVYVRGAVGEYWALSFVPLIILGLLEGCDGKKRKLSALIGGLGLAGAILSHTIFGYTTTLFLIVGLAIYWLIRVIKRDIDLLLITYHSSLLLTGLGLSAFFWLPAAVEMRYTAVAGQIGPTANFRDHFVCLSQLWNSMWGFGGSIPGCLDGMSFKLGKFHLLVAFWGWVAWLRRPRKGLETWYVGAGLGLLLFSIFLTLPASHFVWETVPGMAFIQYPWRFLVYALVGLSMLTPLVLVALRGLARWGVTASLVVAVIFINQKWFNPQFTYQRDAAAFETVQELRFRVSQISDEYLPPKLPRPKSLEELPRDTITAPAGVTTRVEYESGTYGRYTLESNKELDIVINRAAFPGWRAKLDNNNANWESRDGRLVVRLPSGKSKLEIQFSDTPVRQLANIISIATVVILLARFYGEKAIR